MGLFDFLKKNGDEGKAAALPDLSDYANMRVEVTDVDKNLLFMAQLMNLRKDRGELYQYSASLPGLDEETIPVYIRGYHTGTQKAVYMTGTMTPLRQKIWRVETLRVERQGNDRAFFRLNTNLPATATVLDGPDPGERPCRLLDISVGGAHIRSEYPYQEGDRFLLTVKLLEDQKPSVLSCKVLRIIDKGVTTREYGCQFQELTEVDQDHITKNIFDAQRKKRTVR